MELGLALPQYPFSVPGEDPLRWETVATWAARAEQLGFSSLWLSDHLIWSLEKYGGPAQPRAGFEPLTALAALGRVTTTARLGTLVLCSQLRPPGVLAKHLAGLDRVCGGRLDVGLGAGWYEPEFALAEIPFDPPGVRLEQLAETIDVVRAVLTGEPATYAGRHVQVDGALSRPAPAQPGGLPIWVGGKGDRLLRLVAERADGWNTCWTWTFDAYRERLAVLERACDEVGRDPASVARSVGLYALVGEDEADLARRFARLQASAPPGTAPATLGEWREGHLVGTVEQVREQVAAWAGTGVGSLIVTMGAVPFSVTALDDLDLLASAFSEES